MTKEQIERFMDMLYSIDYVESKEKKNEDIRPSDDE